MCNHQTLQVNTLLLNCKTDYEISHLNQNLDSITCILMYSLILLYRGFYGDVYSFAILTNFHCQLGNSEWLIIFLIHIILSLFLYFKLLV